MSQDPLSQLISMSQSLGHPEKDYVILGEGNTSARVDEKTFWVKASGTELRTIEASGFVQVGFSPILSLLNGPNLDDQQIQTALTDAKTDSRSKGRPSVETVLHAVCLSLPGVNFVGHTHPTAVNRITCAVDFERAVSGRLFPDEIVICGPAPAIVRYVDPGLPLARETHRSIRDHMEHFAEPPKMIYMQNHGFIALGSSPQQVENITAMAVKTARILVGTYALGGPNFMTPEAAARIHTRPDEAYRQKIIGES